MRQTMISSRKSKMQRPPFVAVVAFSVSFLLGGCATIINQGEVGVRDTLGSLSDSPSPAGLKIFFWPIFDITRLPTRTVNLQVNADLPSREGLTIASEISILYRMLPDAAPRVLGDIGPDFETALILPVFRSAIADVSSRFDAKDMHTSRRAEIEEAVREQMRGVLAPRGFEVEAVLLKSVRLPPGLASSIEERLRAEQDAERLRFVLAQEQREAERKLIEAKGVRDAQLTLAEGLTPEILKYRAIEALQKLYESSNAKVIITDGRGNLIVDTK